MADDIQTPVELRWLSDTIGVAAMVTLIEAHGGLRLYVPHASEGSALERSIGAEAAAALSAKHGGETLRIPLAKAWRANYYRSHTRPQMSYSEIAKRLGCHEATVHRHLSNAGLTSSQLSLF